MQFDSLTTLTRDPCTKFQNNTRNQLLLTIHTTVVCHVTASSHDTTNSRDIQ